MHQHRWLSRVCPGILLGGIVALGSLGISPQAWALESPAELIGYYESDLEGAMALMATTDNPMAAPQTPREVEAQFAQLLPRFIQSKNRNLTPETIALLSETMLAAAKKHQVDIRLLVSIIAVESSFRSDAVSPTGAMGLGQLTKATSKWLGVANPFDPMDNIAGTTRYLRYLLNKFPDSLDAALASYFQGPGSVEREGIKPDSQHYLFKVSTVLDNFQTEYFKLTLNP